MEGKVHSFQSLGTLDGPGIRFVVFLQGCNLRCGCCHNPDTWYRIEGKDYTPIEVIEKAKKYKEYFKNKGGITVSGGEPLLQAKFVKELFVLSKKEDINTCLDTSGSIINDDIKELLKYTDRVLLDIKYNSNDLYKKYVGCNLDDVINFLSYLNEKEIPTTIRQVIIPSLNDNEENLLFLKELKSKYKCIDEIELLPFKKLCQIKYDNLNIDFPFKDYDEPTKELMKELKQKLLYNYKKNY